MVGCVLLVFGVPVDAQVLTFDEMAPDPNQSPILGSVVCAAPNGFQFYSDHFHVFGPDFITDFSWNGSTHMGYESVRGYPITMERVGPGTFSLFSLDAGEFYAQPSATHPDAEWITLTGFQADGGVVTHSFFLDGIRDGVGGVQDFEHFVLPNTFVNLRSVVFTGWRTGNEPGGLSFDNLEYAFDQPEVLPPCQYYPLPSDTPVVSFVSPAAGTVQGTVPVEANATDNVAVVSVQFKVDGVDLGVADTQAPYTLAWDTTTVPDGPHTLSVEAHDADNNVGTASILVNVQNEVVVSNGPHYLEFDGVDDYVHVGDAPALSFGNGASDTPLTIETWLRPDVLGKHQLIGKWGESSNQEYKLQIAAGTIRLDLRDESAHAQASAFTAGVSQLLGSWHHLAVTYDGRGGATAADGIAVYIDGVSVPLSRINDPAYAAMENLAAPVEIGREGPGWNQYDGGLDEIRLWSVARSASQIQATMALELTGGEAGLVAYWRFNEGAGLSAADESAGTSAATLTNGTQWAAGGPLAPDETAPVISNIVVSNLTSASVTISFNTNELSTGWVSYTPTVCPCTDVFSAGIGTSHLVTLTNLLPDTVYQFEVHAHDAADNQESSAPMTFHTLAPVIDTQAPTVNIVSPAGGVVTGSVALEASAADNVGVSSVQFRIDGAYIGVADTTAPYTLSWDSTTVSDGAHTITADARDGANNLGSASVVVVVQNQPVSAGPHYLELDGIDDHLVVADAPALSFGNGTADTPLTFEMWLRPDALAKHRLIGKWGEASNQEYRVQIAAGTIRVDFRDQSTGGQATVFTNGLPPMIGGWHHLAVTYDGRGGATAANGITVYIDGAAQSLSRSNDPAYVAMENLAAPVEIGREGPAWNQYDGGLDDLRVWNVARSAAEIAGAMSHELTGAESGLVAYWRFNEGSGTTAADDSPFSHVATLTAGPFFVPGGPLAPDTFPPDITNIVISNVTASGATISFATSEPTTGWLSYTAGAACPCTDVFSAGVATSHVITLTGLSSDTEYRFQVKARDNANNEQTAAEMTFHTLVISTDTQAPIVTITSPAAGTQAGTITLAATATDDVGVQSVQFRIDGAAFGAADVTSPYSIALDTTTLTDGAHTLTADARDAANNLGSASVTFIVQNQVISTGPHYLEVDGVDDYVSVADAAALSFGTGATDSALTFEMWLRPDRVAKHRLLGKWGESSNQEYKLELAAGTLRLDLRDQSTQGLATVFTNGLPAITGAWHHVAVTYDGRGGPTAANGVTIYVDGVSIPLTRTTSASYVAMENLAAPVEIGREGPFWNQYDGGLDDLRIWNVARSAAEIAGAMSSELTGAEPGLVAYWRFNEGSGSSVVDDSPFNHTATLIAGASFVQGGPLAPDTFPPDITNVMVSDVTTSSVTISFTTSEPATGWVSFSPTAACPCTDVYSAGTGTTHVVTLTGLAPDTQYQFQAKARDAANNEQLVAASTFHTLAPSTDSQPPTVSFVTPTGGAVAGVIAVEVSAADNVAVTQVGLQVDGVAVGAPDSQAPFAFLLDTTTLTEGAHTITASARDAANNLGSASISVLVQNTPATSDPHYVTFDGVDDYASVADAPALSFGNGTADTPLTVEMWLNTNAMGKHGLIGKWGESTNQEYRLYIATGSIRVDLRDQSSRGMATAFTTSIPPLTGAWHHLAFTYDGRGGATAANGIMIYIDGVAMPLARINDPAYVAMENLAAPVEIARQGPSWNQYNGSLDDLRVWNVARSQSEIQAARSAELTGVEPGLVAYWRFNEGVGNTVADDSPQHHPATMVISPLWVAGGPLAP